MKVSIKLFAVARQTADAEQVEVELPSSSTVGDLRRALAEQYPALAPLLRHVLFAVDAEYASDATPLAAGSEVACIPPVSGG